MDVASMRAQRDAHRKTATRARARAALYTKRAEEAEKKADAYDVVLAEIDKDNIAPAADDVVPVDGAPDPTFPLLDMIDAVLLDHPDGLTPTKISEIILERTSQQIAAYFIQNALSRNSEDKGEKRGWKKIGKYRAALWFHRTHIPAPIAPSKEAANY